MKKGKVFLVGAGPGDPELLTIKAQKVLQKADVIVYDYLASEEILDLAKQEAEKIYVGKKAGKHTLPQEDINNLLIKKAKQGKIVVRLKGGDPFVFGRGGEEAEALFEENIPFEIIPGITSAIAVPAYAGIPVTHRDYTSTLAIITGHEAEGKAESKIDFSALAKIGTLIFLMGVKNLPFIVENLIKNGKSEDTPVAIIRWGTLEKQKTVVGCLKDIVEKAKKENISPPAVIIVGEVVKLREKLAWFEKKPLFGKKIVITRTRKQASKLSEKLRELGAKCYEIPTIEIKPLESKEMEEEIKKLGSYDWIVFTSENGVEIFLQKVFEQGFDARIFSHIKIAVIGSATKNKLLSFGLKADLMPQNSFTQEGLVSEFSKLNLREKRILIARAKKARNVLPEKLKELGAYVKVLPIYETVLPENSKEKLKNVVKEGVDVITFTSSSTVENFFELLKEEKALMEKLKKETVFASIGPITTETLKKYGFEPQIQAKVYNIDGLIEAILNWFEKGGRKNEVNS